MRKGFVNWPKFKFKNITFRSGIIMKQQGNKQRMRGDERTTEHFKFVDSEAEDGQKSRLKKQDKKKHKDGFARWSDYITYDSGQIEIPISDDESISVSPAKLQSSSLVETGNSKQIVQVPSSNQEPPKTKAKYHEKEKQTLLQKLSKQQPSLNTQNQRPNLPISPFSIPISEIKPKESLYANTRNSQKFLLELLNEECKKVQQKNSENVKIKESKNDNKQSRKSDAHTRKSNIYKQAQKIQQKAKPKEIIEAQVRPKRVTINDRGRIKFPTDSISGEFQYVLPSQLRENESERKRKLVIHQQQQDQREVEPMDIVDHQQQQRQKRKAQAKQQLQKVTKAKEKLTQLSKNVPKRKITKQKSKVARVIDQSLGNKSNHHQSKDKQPQGSKKTIQTKPTKQTLATQEQKIRKFKKQQKSQVQIISRRQSTPKMYTRPKRFRHQTLNFWENQKVVYSKQGLVLGINSLKNFAFLEIIGFNSVESIATNKVYFSSLYIKITINLKPRQSIYSLGINQSKMKEHRLQIKNFNQIELTAIAKKSKKPSLRIMVDDIEQADVKDPVTVKKGQTFSIENLSTNASHSILVCFYSSERTPKNSPSSSS